MILKLRQYIECEYGKYFEDIFVENPKELNVQPNREYSAELEKTIQIPALFPIKETPILCNFVNYYLDDEYHSYAVYPDCVFIMNDNGKTIDRY